MRVIGLTGSIACGKSTISRYLISRGFPVVDGDLISRELTAPGSPVLEEIRRSFGDRYMNENGNLNRRALGQLIFQDEHARSRLDAVMAPHLIRLTREGIEQYRSEGAELCFLDMPLLFEKQYDRLCDSVWTVWLPEDLQLSRLIARDQLSEEDAMSRIRSVMSSDEKASRATYVIDNSGSVRQTLAAVDQLLQQELAAGRPASFAPPSPFRAAPVPPAAPPQAIRPAPASADPGVMVRPAAASPDPGVMVRPASARRQHSPRKAAWTMPQWMKISLIVSAVLFALSVTAFSLMSAYLSRQQEKHAQEEAAVRAYYHFDDYEAQYRTAVERYAAEFNLKPAFVCAVIRAESSFRPQAESGKSARGMMQLREGAASDRARELGIADFDFSMMFQPELNIRLGCAHLRYLIRKFGDSLPTVMSAYNAGEGNVASWLTDSAVSTGGRTIDAGSIPFEDTKDYVGRVAEYYGVYEKQFYTVTPDDLPADHPDAAAL